MSKRRTINLISAAKVKRHNPLFLEIAEKKTANHLMDFSRSNFKAHVDLHLSQLIRWYASKPRNPR